MNKIQTFELNYVPNRNTAWQTFNLAATVTQVSSVRGDALSTYELLPVQWLQKVVEAGKERQIVQQAFSQYTIPEGHNMMVIPKRKKFLARGSWETSSEEYSVNTPVTWTQINTDDGVQITPADEHYGVEITNKAIRTNAIPIVNYCREEITYRMADVVDTACSTALDDATAMSNTVWGMQTIFGGDATDANNNLDDGDVLTTQMINKAKRLLESTLGYYWASNVWTKSAVTKNPWESGKDGPFMLYIAHEQAETLRNDSQFVNAAEYGDREVILNGEIGQYLGVKVLTTTKVPALASGDTFTHQGGTVSVDTNVHTCFMVKAGTCGSIVWGLKPRINVFDWPSDMKKRITLEMSYAAAAVQADSIVKLAVTDI